MDIRQITPNYFVAPQLDPADMADIAAAGITTIISNRLYFVYRNRNQTKTYNKFTFINFAFNVN